MIYLLDLTLGGVVYRFAREHVDVLTLAGDEVGYSAGLGIDEWGESWSLETDSGQEDLVVEIQGDEIDAPGLALLGIYLPTASAVYSRLRTGQRWEQREILYEGPVSEPVHGQRGEPIRFALRRIPPEAGAVDPPSWTLGPKGIVYPTVFGDQDLGAGVYTTISTGRAAGEVVVAAHPCPPGTQVQMIGESGDTLLATHTVQYDGRVSWVDHPGNAGRSYLTRWLSPGMLRPLSRDQPVVTAGHLLERMLVLAGGADLARVAAAVPLLTLPVAGYYDEQIEPMAWLREHLLPLIPVALLRGPRGLYPVVWRPYLSGYQADHDLRVERGEIVRISDVTWDGDAIVNDLMIAYRPLFEEGEPDPYYARRLQYTGEPSIQASADVDVVYWGPASASRATYGARQELIESDILTDPAAAHEVCRWRLKRYGQPSRVVSYVLGEEIQVALGQGVYLEDLESGVRGMALVEAVSDVGDGLQRMTVRVV